MFKNQYLQRFDVSRHQKQPPPSVAVSSISFTMKLSTSLKVAAGTRACPARRSVSPLPGRPARSGTRSSISLARKTGRQACARRARPAAHFSSTLRHASPRRHPAAAARSADACPPRCQRHPPEHRYARLSRYRPPRRRTDRRALRRVVHPIALRRNTRA